MSDLSRKKEIHKKYYTDAVVLVGVFCILTMISAVAGLVYFSSEKRYHTSEINTPVGSLTPEEMSKDNLPDHGALYRDCGSALQPTGYPYWYPQDIREACKKVLEGENSDHYSEIRERLRAFGYISE